VCMLMAELASFGDRDQCCQDDWTHCVEVNR
jgi:hypothetical protein